jgi:hypothetical protein
MGPIRTERIERFRRQSHAFSFQVLQRQGNGAAVVEVPVLLLIYEGILTPTHILDIRRAELSGKEFSTRLEITGRDQEADFIGRGTQARLRLFKQQRQRKEPLALPAVELWRGFKCLLLQCVEYFHSRQGANSHNKN